MNILITGGNGFIAKSLKEYFSDLKKYNIFAPTSKELNLIDEALVDEYILSNKIGIIIHTANKGGGRDTSEMGNISEYNLRMFFNIVKHEANVKKIISFGSGAEYAKHKPIVDVVETDSELQLPLDEYGLYKSITSKYIQRSNNIIQLRVFGCYGEYENYLFKFISNAIVKNIFRLPIVINKNVFFDYIYIDDLVEIVGYFVENDAKEKVYNASSGKKVDLITLAELVNVTSEFKSEIVVLNEGLNDEYTSSNKRLLSELDGFEFTSHKDAINKMRKYFLSKQDLLDKETIINDPYLKKCENFWKGKK